MNPNAEHLISRGSTLFDEAVANGGRRRRYPPELKKIVRVLCLEHKLPAHKIISIIPVSKASVRKWLQKQGRIKKKLAFKKITIVKNEILQNVVDWPLFKRPIHNILEYLQRA